MYLKSIQLFSQLYGPLKYCEEISRYNNYVLLQCYDEAKNVPFFVLCVTSHKNLLLEHSVHNIKFDKITEFIHTA